MNECVKLVVEQQDDVIMVVIQSGEYVRLLHMMDDGYAVSGKMLEILRCLKKTVLLDIIKRFENPEIVFSPSACEFVQAYCGNDNYQKILTARRAVAEKAREAQHDVLMSRLKVLYHQAGKVSLEVWHFAKENALAADLANMVGLEKIYQGIRRVELPESLFSDEFLVEHGECQELANRYHTRKYTGRYTGIDSEAMIATIITCYPQGAELLFKADDRDLDMELVKSKRFEVFMQSNVKNRYLRLFAALRRYRETLPRFKRQPWYLPLEDYVEWYKFNRIEADKWIRKERGFIFWLIVKLYADM